MKKNWILAVVVAVLLAACGDSKELLESRQSAQQAQNQVAGLQNEVREMKALLVKQEKVTAELRQDLKKKSDENKVNARLADIRGQRLIQAGQDLDSAHTALRGGSTSAKKVSLVKKETPRKK